MLQLNNTAEWQAPRTVHTGLHFEIERSSVSQISKHRATGDFSSIGIDGCFDLSYHAPTSLGRVGLSQSKWKWDTGPSKSCFPKAGIESQCQRTIGGTPIPQDFGYFVKSSQFFVGIAVLSKCRHHFLDSLRCLLLRNLCRCNSSDRRSTHIVARSCSRDRPRGSHTKGETGGTKIARKE